MQTLLIELGWFVKYTTWHLKHDRRASDAPIRDHISQCRSHPGTWRLLWWHGHFVKAFPRSRSLIKNKKKMNRVTKWNIVDERWRVSQGCCTNEITHPYITSSSESFSIEKAGLSFNWESGEQISSPNVIHFWEKWQCVHVCFLLNWLTIKSIFRRWVHKS